MGRQYDTTYHGNSLSETETVCYQFIEFGKMKREWNMQEEEILGWQLSQIFTYTLTYGEVNKLGHMNKHAKGELSSSL
jgi:hypothetical protein